MFLDRNKHQHSEGREAGDVDAGDQDDGDNDDDDDETYQPGDDDNGDDKDDYATRAMMKRVASPSPTMEMRSPSRDPMPMTWFRMMKA